VVAHPRPPDASLSRHAAAGPGHETTLTDHRLELGIGVDDVIVQHSDTPGTPFGYGTYGSRSASVGGMAAVKAADKIRAKAKLYAAHMLEASPDDIEVDGANYQVKGSPDKVKTFQEISFAIGLGFSLPEDMEPYLDETAYYDTPNCTWPFGTHIAMVEVDEATGEVDLVRFIAVDDCGNRINPMIVEGQIHGGLAQGIGQALWEGAVYDDHGQLLSGSMLDYALPKASRLPSFELDETVTPSPVNPLGVKGIGEAGTIARRRRSSTPSSTPCPASASDISTCRSPRRRSGRPCSPRRRPGVIPSAFSYQRPSTVDEAAAIASTRRPRSWPVATASCRSSSCAGADRGRHRHRPAPGSRASDTRRTAAPRWAR
jgi:hypothetical protein